MRRLLPLLALLAGLAVPAVAHAAPSFVAVDGDWEAPIHVAAPPHDPSRLFVVQRGGVVRVVVEGAVQAAPFADLTGQVGLNGERGLLSIAFPPDYETSGLAYVYLAAPDGELQVRELRRSALDPNRTDGTQRIVWRQPHAQASNHNGGTLDFGPDGMLWLATGDGGGSNDQFGHAQDAASQLGKVLRIDPGASGAGSYTVPPGNPYGTAVFSSGLRNPFRFSFDRLTGDLLIGDVGQAAREEIDWVRFDEGLGRAGNYGWPCFEGFLPGPRSCTPERLIEPVHDYSRPNPRAVTGGFVVRDPGLPSLVGRYIYADTYAGEVRSLALGRPATGDASAGLPARPNLVSFGEDACGHLYVVTIDPGTVERIQDGAPGPCVPEPAPRPLPEPAAGGGDPAPEGAGSGQPGIPPSTADTSAPALRVSVAGRRTLLPRRRLRVAVRTDEAATVRASGRLRGVARMRTAQRQVAADRRTVLTVRIGRRAARELRRTLRRKRVVTALTILARDAAGNQRRVTRRIVVPRLR
jgi:glucose/arabinose dehydrogenase